MTGPDPATDDELVSAYLDGEATPDERARVEADPALLERVEELRRVAGRVAVPPVPPASAARDAAVAQALAAARTDGAGDEGGPVPPVVDLEGRRRRRMAGALAAAAAVIVALLAVPALVDDEPPSRFDEVAASIPDRDVVTPEADSPGNGAEELDGGQGGEDAAGVDDPQGGDLPSSTAPATQPSADAPSGAGRQAPDLGTFTTREEARAVVTAAIDDALLRSGEAGQENRAWYWSDQGSACEQAIRAQDRELAQLVYGARYRIGDVPHQVMVFVLYDTGATNGTHRIYEHRLPGCELVSAQTLTPHR